MNQAQEQISLTVLAGGEGLRMGGMDKCLMEVNGKTILSRLVETFNSQVETIYLNANGDPSRFFDYDLPIIKDQQDTAVGPLGGLLSALKHHKQGPSSTQWLMTVAGDCPFLPCELPNRLLASVEAGDTIVYCRCGGRDHFVIGIWSTELIDSLEGFLDQGGRSVGRFIRSQNHRVLDFPDSDTRLFMNINTPDELAVANKV